MQEENDHTYQVTYHVSNKRIRTNIQSYYLKSVSTFHLGIDTYARTKKTKVIVVPGTNILISWLKLWKMIASSDCVVLISGYIVRWLMKKGWRRTLSELDEWMKEDYVFFIDQEFMKEIRSDLEWVDFLTNYINALGLNSVSVQNEQVMSSFIQKYSPQNLSSFESKKLKHETSQDNFQFLPFIGDGDVQRGLKLKRFLKGTFQRTSRNLASVTIGSERYWIRGKKNQNRAMEGDEVCILPNDNDAIVVSILNRSNRNIVCSLRNHDVIDRSKIVVPLDRKHPNIKIYSTENLANKRFVVRVSNWSINSKYPTGYFVKIIGDIGDITTESKSLLIEHQLEGTLEPFKPESFLEIENIKKETMQERTDLRKSHFIFSIDPIGCLDIDDAFSVRKLENNCIEIGVHIADVSHWVRKDSALDYEARKRMSTVYLIDRRLDMIPSKLSTELCSLQMGQNRFAVSVIWKMDRDGKILDTWYGRTFICSKYALHYEQAHNLVRNIKKKPVDIGYWKECQVSLQDLPKLCESIDILTNYSRIFRQKREKNGALELVNLEDASFSLDDSNQLIGMKNEEHIEVHDVVAEWMILANSVVAAEIHKKFPTNSLLRRHPNPLPEKFSLLCEIATENGIKIDTRSSKSLAESFNNLKKLEDPYIELLLRSHATRAMQEAQYFASGDLGEKDYCHYGLGLQFYTHFTSPIRRYPDILVHRLLLADPSDSSMCSQLEISKMSKLANFVHHQCQAIQRTSTQWFTGLHFLKSPSACVLMAIVESVGENYLNVYVPEIKLKSRLYLTDQENILITPSNGMMDGLGMTDGIDYEINSTSTSLTLMVRKSNEKTETLVFKVFDRIQVRILVSESQHHLPTITVQLHSLNRSTRKSFSTEGPSADFMNRRKIKPMELEDEILKLFNVDVPDSTKASLYSFVESRVSEESSPEETCEIAVEDLKSSISRLVHKRQVLYQRNHENPGTMRYRDNLQKINTKIAQFNGLMM